MADTIAECREIAQRVYRLRADLTRHGARSRVKRGMTEPLFRLTVLFTIFPTPLRCRYVRDSDAAHAECFPRR